MKADRRIAIKDYRRKKWSPEGADLWRALSGGDENPQCGQQETEGGVGIYDLRMTIYE